MTVTDGTFRATWTSLWLRLITIAPIALLFAVIPQFPAQIANWRDYLTSGEIIFELFLRCLFVAWLGVYLGTLCTAIATPFLLRWPSSRNRTARIATRIAVVAAAYFDLSIVARLLVQSLEKWTGLQWFPTMMVYSAAFALTLLIPRGRRQLATSLDGFLSDKTTRRIAITTGIASAGLIASEWTLGEVGARSRGASGASHPPGPNILLVTFDALSAEDMSLYGYRRPTTPHLNQFADKSSVFTSFYSASTFTTPCVATILTGAYPSEDRVYHLQGRLHGEYETRTLPRLMRAGGYSTGASISNPAAYFLAQGTATDFDVLPDPPYRTAGLDVWRATGILHQHFTYGSRERDLVDVERIRDYRPFHLDTDYPNLFGRTESGFSPIASFSQAREVVDRLPDGFFMWVHVLAPHSPYLPDARWMGRYLPRGEMMTETDQETFPWWPNYKPKEQYRVDKDRSRYDEFVSEVDSCFGDFLSGLERVGRLNNTAVVVAADHGESFQGGFFTHGGPYQVRPEIHIPLMIRMPGQQQGRRFSLTADQTVMAPTLLDIAGLPRPAWMRGQSLVPRLRSDDSGEGSGRAFTQYLATNSIFKPLNSGTVGVIDNRQQYVLDLATGSGRLRSLDEAHIWDSDHSNENPALARAMRDMIYSRFPDLPRKQA